MNAGSLTFSPLNIRVIGGFFVSIILYLLGIAAIGTPALWIIETISALWIVFILAFIFFRHISVLLIGFYPFFAVASVFPSLIMISNQAFISELGVYGTASNLFSSLQLYSMVTAAILIWGSVGEKKPVVFRTIVDLRLIVFCFSAVFVLSSIYIFLTNGTAVSIALDRFSYLERVGYVGRKIYNNIPVMVFLLGIYVALEKLNKLRLMGCLIVILMLFIQYGFGVKFSGFLMSMYAFIFGMALPYGINDRLLRRTIIGVMIFSAVAILIIVPTQYERLGVDSGLLAIGRRFVAQGQLFWISIQEGVLFLSYEDMLSKVSEIFSPILGNPYSDGGIVTLMREYAPEKIFLDYRERGVVFTFGYPAVLVYSLGMILAPVAHVFVVFFYLLLFLWFVRRGRTGIKYGAFIGVIVVVLGFKAWLVGIRIVTSGDFGELYKLVISVIVLEAVIFTAKMLRMIVTSPVERISH